MSLFSNNTGLARGNFSEMFPNPFLDIATFSMPQSMKNALYWAEYLWGNNGTYRSAMERVASYFLTDIEFGDKGEASDEEQDNWKDFLRDTLGFYAELQRLMIGRLAYGNHFISVLAPFNRYLVCPKCGGSWPLKVVYNNRNFAFSWDDMKFVAQCPACAVGTGYRGPFRVDDRADDNEKKVRFKHWSPHEIELLHDYYTDQVAYLWRIPEDYKQQVRRGNLFHLERSSLQVIEAIKRNQMFRFNDDVIFHMKEPTLAGIRNRGWGFPRVLTNFRQIYYVQVLRRYNEAIALDYVIPFRLITPAPRPGGGGGGGGGAASMMNDPMMGFNMGDFRSQIMAMVRRRRRDPAGWNVLPFPVQFQSLGGDASKLAPQDMLNGGTEQLLNDAQVPVDLYKGSLQLQTAPPALRVFEATWQPLVFETNAFIRWAVQQLSQLLNWKPVDASLKRVTIADDIQKMMMQLQLMMGQQASGTTAFKSIGLDWKQEQRRMGEEAMFQSEQQAKIQEEMQQHGFAQQLAQGNVSPGPGAGPVQSGPGGQQPAQGGGGGQGGQQGAVMPQLPVDQYLSTMGPNTPTDPQTMLQAADGLAQGLLGLDSTTRISQLRLLSQKSEIMAQIVKGRLEKLRRNARNQAGSAMLAQQYGGNGQ